MMEKKHKSSWRIGCNSTQKKAFSRWRRVTELMTEEKECLSLLFLDELDHVFKLLSGFERTLAD